MQHALHPLLWPDVTLVQLMCALPLAWLLTGFIRHKVPDAVSLGLALIVALLLPWNYAAARAQHELIALRGLIELSRIGEAQTLAQRLVALDAEQALDGIALPQVAANLAREVRELEIRVAVPLEAGATAAERLERARLFAMLGRSAEAREVLNSLEGPDSACLRATILENEGEWDAALLAYTQARGEWQTQPPSTDRASGLMQATRGLAYTQRKSGRYAEAEATYQELLALAPTADSHFLLAQFYEDTQQAEPARAHARRAMALAPDAYRQSGEKLIKKLSVYHFGCLGVHRAESQ